MVSSTKEFMTMPFFVVDRVEGKRILTCNQQTWTISPPLTTEHEKIIYGALSFANPVKTELNIRADFNVFCRRIYNRSGENVRQKSIMLLNDIIETAITITITEDKTSKTFRFIDKIKISDSNINITLNQRYCDTLNDPNSRIVFQYKLKKQCHSKLSKAIYQHMPSRASYATPENPQKISLGRLLQDVGHRPIQHKSKRYQLFTNNNNSVIKQLDGARMMGNKIFKCRLIENSNKTDYNFLCWAVETKKRIIHKPTGKLFRAFEIGGGTWKQWTKLLENKSTMEFDMYETEALEYIFNWEKCAKMYLMAKCLMGGYFTECLGIVKNHILEDNKVFKSPVHMLNNKIIHCLRTGKFLKS